jgi:hypothetical protein
LILTKEDEGKLSAETCGELLSVIDIFLAGASGRSLIDAIEVQDFCLDLRQLITHSMEIEDVI